MRPKTSHRARTAILLTLAAAAAASPALAARAQPVDATVMIRVIGQVRIVKGLDARTWRPAVLDRSEVEVGTGSGFLVSPDGWVVTNQHVIANEKFEAMVEGEKLEVTIDVRRVEVLVRQNADSRLYRRYVASVYASDADDDLAILHIGGSTLPYLGLGDSDAAEVGDSVSAVGFPYGTLLELARPASDDSLPDASVSTGTLSAFRADGVNQRRFLQITAPLNPGNSGGPVVDAEGYVVGVAQSRVRGANAIGFALPINLVKRLLLLHGLATSLPVDLLSAGPLIAAAGKGVALRVPAGFEDRSPVRLRVDGSSGLPRPAMDAGGVAEELALRIDRVASMHTVEQLERALLSDGVFERFAAAANPRRRPTPPGATRRGVAGYATGTHAATGVAWKVVYHVIDLGKEKLVARYIGSADTVAANRSILQSSLAELDASPLLTGEVARPIPSNWSSAPAASGVPTLDGWVVEPGNPWHCAASLAAPATGMAMSPPDDFTVVLRATWYPASADLAAAAAAARQCSPQPGRYGQASYATRADSFGLAYQVEGVFVPQAGQGMWQLELIAPVAKSGFVTGVFADWLKMFGR